VAETVAEVSHAPQDLGLLVASGGQWKDGVVIGLGDGVAHAVGSPVVPIGLDDTLIGEWIVTL